MPLGVTEMCGQMYCVILLGGRLGFLWWIVGGVGANAWIDRKKSRV